MLEQSKQLVSLLFECFKVENLVFFYAQQKGSQSFHKSPFEGTRDTKQLVSLLFECFKVENLVFFYAQQKGSQSFHKYPFEQLSFFARKRRDTGFFCRYFFLRVKEGTRDFFAKQGIRIPLLEQVSLRRDTYPFADYLFEGICA